MEKKKSNERIVKYNEMQTFSFTTIAVIFRGTKFGHFMIFSPRRTSAKFTQNVYNIAAALKRLRERERERERQILTVILLLAGECPVSSCSFILYFTPSWPNLNTSRPGRRCGRHSPGRKSWSIRFDTQHVIVKSEVCLTVKCTGQTI